MSWPLCADLVPHCPGGWGGRKTTLWLGLSLSLRSFMTFDYNEGHSSPAFMLALNLVSDLR